MTAGRSCLPSEADEDSPRKREPVPESAPELFLRTFHELVPFLGGQNMTDEPAAAGEFAIRDELGC